MIRQEGGWQHVGDVVLRIVDKLEANQITHLETKRTETMTEQELKSLRHVIFYLWRDEQKHFEDCELNGDTDDHIFSYLETLNDYLERELNHSIKKETEV